MHLNCFLSRLVTNNHGLAHPYLGLLNYLLMMHRSWAPGRRGDEVMYVGAYYWLTLSMDLASHHPPGAKNFEMVPKF